MTLPSRFVMRFVMDLKKDSWMVGDAAAEEELPVAFLFATVLGTCFCVGLDENPSDLDAGDCFTGVNEALAACSAD